MIRFFLLLFCFPLFAQQIHVIYTSALIPLQPELRMQEYLACLQQLRNFGFDPYIIESTPISSSFYDAVTERVFYPKTDDPAIKNKGVRETLSVRKCLPQIPIGDDDIVIKITGRYLMRDRYFIDTVLATQNLYDVWGVFGKHFVSEGHLFTGCYAMRGKYFKGIYNGMDLETVERDFVSIEKIFGEYIDENRLRVCKLPSVHVKARVCYYRIEDATYYDF